MCIGSLILRALFVRSLVVDIELSAPKFSAPDDVNQLNFLTNFLPVLLPSPTLRAMANEAPIFSQILCALYQAEFSRCAEKFPTRRATRGLSEYDQFLALCFGQLTYRESLRDIVACLQSKKSLLYHLGFRGRLTRTNLAYANKHRDWRLFQAVAEILMKRAARLYQQEPTNLDLPSMVFALDASIISLGLELFPWGYYARTGRAALKLHLLLSLKGNLPAWGAITQPDLPDMKMLDEIPIQPGAFYIMDRGYLDFVRLYRVQQAGACFVVRCKRHVKLAVVQSHSVDKSTGLRCDQTVRLRSSWSRKSFPQPLRKIRVYDPENKVTLVLLTNNFVLSAHVIAELYRRRWQVELFFKWIKQHLRIRSFFGRSENAVRSQIWSAIAAYLLVAILKKELKVEKTLNEMLQIISVNIFEQTPVNTLFFDEPVINLPGQRFCANQKLLLLNDI
ncbi:MAG TPA: IS4 family transposase [Nitrososphaera sp.]|nr:IS4 family transposase [Nitrososphaera sp.]